MQKYIQDFIMQEKGFFNSLVRTKLACIAAGCVTKSPVYWRFCLSATQTTFDTQQINSLNIRLTLLKVYFILELHPPLDLFILEKKMQSYLPHKFVHIFKWALMSKVHVMFLQFIIGWFCFAVSRYKGNGPYDNQ